jgi:hypothetical protein
VDFRLASGDPTSKFGLKRVCRNSVWRGFVAGWWKSGTACDRWPCMGSWYAIRVYGYCFQIDFSLLCIHVMV